MTETFLLALAFIGVAAGSIYASATKRLFSAVLGFGVAMLSLGAIYFILNQAFLGIIHILVYVGGVSVLALFAYITSISSYEVEEENKPFRVAGILASISVFALVFLAGIMLSRGLKLSLYKQISAEEVGKVLLTQRLLDFELISLLLLVALVSAIAVVARRNEND